MPLFLIRFGEYLTTILGVGMSLLGLLFLWVLAARFLEILAARRARRLERSYRDAINQLANGTAPEVLDRLRRVPRRHRDVIGRLVLNSLQVIAGDAVEPLRAGADAMGLVDRWRDGISNRRWWIRAESATALGLLRLPAANQLLAPLLDDPHEQVRAATVTALGWIANPTTIPSLLARLHDETRHQRVRIVEALQHFGADVGPSLLTAAAAHPALAPVLADLAGQLRLTDTVDLLIEWADHPARETREAAWKALSAIGLDDRGYYHALRALGDDVPRVRAMAARALGRARRSTAAAYLGRCLQDEWEVAAEAALALRHLGSAGTQVLQAAMAGDGLAADLARQVLWQGSPAGEIAA